jgi:hypothetical protein
MVKNKALACPSILLLKKAPLEIKDNSMDLSLYAVSNSCEILSRGDKIQAIGYDPRNSKELFQKIIYLKTGSELYIKRSAIEIEQGGKKSTLRF